MKDKIGNITRWILYLLLALSVIPGVLFYADMLSTDVFIDWSLILLFTAVGIMVISPIYGFVSNPQNVIKLVISIVAFAVVVIISYSIAGNEISELRLEELKTTAETSRLVGMGMYVTFIGFGLTILAILYASIIKLFK